MATTPPALDYLPPPTQPRFSTLAIIAAAVSFFVTPAILCGVFAWGYNVDGLDTWSTEPLWLRILGNILILFALVLPLLLAYIAARRIRRSNQQVRGTSLCYAATILPLFILGMMLLGLLVQLFAKR